MVETDLLRRSNALLILDGVRLTQFSKNKLFGELILILVISHCWLLDFQKVEWEAQPLFIRLLSCGISCQF